MTRPFVPHFILEKYQAEQYQGDFQAATLFIDISGFTSLTETLIRHQREGAETLTGALAAIFGPLVRQVHARGGIIPLFAGDALTAVFPLDPEQPRQTILDALGTACLIQADFADHHIHTQYGNFQMGIKLGFSCGQVQWGIPHQGDAATFYFRGEAMNSCARCQQLAHMGEIVIDERVREVVQEFGHLDPIANAPTHYNLIACTLDTVGSERFTPPPTHEALRPFLHPAVLDLTEGGEFREICPIFIAFDEPDSSSQLHTFISEAMLLAQRYGGSLSQLDFGDKGSLMVFWFGAPMTYENNIERAAQFLLALQTATDNLDGPIQWQAGMTFGIVWAGIRGGVERCEYGAVGDVVNLAARIATQPHWGDVWVSQAVYERIKNAYLFDTLGAFRFKGKQQEANIYRLLRPRQHNEVSFHTDSMIGRQYELAQLHQHLEPIFDGRFAGIIYIYGEAGIGKTRLLHELHKQLSQQRRLSWFHCPAEEILRQSLNPFKYFLIRYFEQSAEHDSQQNQAKFNEIFDSLIQRVLSRRTAQPEETERIVQELRRTRSMLAALVGLYWPGSLYEQLEPKLRFQNTLTALKNLMLAESILQPLIIELEDAHWLDEDSQELLAILSRHIPYYPLAILCSGRYRDDGRKFRFKVDANTLEAAIELTYLEPPHIRTLVEEVIAKQVSENLLQFLWQKSNGNPFFVEQISLDLKERGLLSPVLHSAHYELLDQHLDEVPSNISAVLIARLDRLTAEVKQVVQTAAVLGREFELLILGHMLQNDGELSHKVKTAEQAQIWATLNNIRYIFKHALLRDSAYDMQLRARLRQLHNLAGKAIEAVYKSDLAPHYADLAYHYDQAEDITEAARWYHLAGLHAMSRFANEEALTYLNRALNLTSTQDRVTQYNLLLAREQIYSVQGNREAQFKDLTHLGSHASILDDDRRRVEISLRLTKFAYLTGDYAAAIAAAKLGVTLAQQTKHLQGEAEGQLYWGRSLWRRGLFEEAMTHLKRALSLARAAESPHIEADAQRNLGVVFASQGNFEEAENQGKAALRIYRQIGDTSGIGAALNHLGEILRERGEFSASRDYYQEALQISQRTGERESESLLRRSLGRSAVQQGLFMQAQAELEKGLQIDRETGNLQGEGEILCEMGHVHLFLGQYDAARAYYEDALEICGDIGDQQVEGVVLAHLGLLFHQLGETAVSWEYNLQALRLIQNIGDSSMEATALTYLGHVLSGLKQPARAATYYQDALLIRRQLKQAHRAIEPMAGLAQLYHAQGKKSEAIGEAREIWQHIDKQGLIGIQEPIHVCLICYRIFRESDDTETAESILHLAYHQLQDKAKQLASDQLSHAFLHNVTAHQEIVTAWQKTLPDS